MDNSGNLSKRFVDTLSKRYARKTALADDISDVLDMDKISVYRRLRGSVKFTVDELAALAAHYRISLDHILGDISPKPYESIRMELPIIDTQTGFDTDMLREQIPQLELFVQEPDTELGGAVYSMPVLFYAPYKHLTRFFLFKWGHYYASHDSYDRLETVVIPDELALYYQQLHENIRKIQYTFFIWDESIVANVVKDIRYFYSMGLISAPELELLKQDLERFLDNLERVVAAGRYPDSGNRFEFYLSSMNINTSHMYFYSEKFRTYCMEVFVIRSMVTTNRNTCDMMRRRIRGVKSGAVLISESAEKERILFFNQQREIVSQLQSE